MTPIGRNFENNIKSHKNTNRKLCKCHRTEDSVWYIFHVSPNLSINQYNSTQCSNKISGKNGQVDFKMHV